MTRNRRDAAPEGRQDKPGGDKPGKADGSDAGAERRAALSADEVAAYLRRHPDFLQQYPQILEVLEPPRRGELNGQPTSVVDFQQAMVERLRGEREELRQRHSEIVMAGRSNIAAQHRVHQAVLAMLAARSFEHLIETVTTDLAVYLDVDVVTICVEHSPQPAIPKVRLGGVLRIEPGTVNELFGNGRRTLLRGEVTGDSRFFGSGAGLVRSDALIRLRVSDNSPPALLALGARTPHHFEEGQGTELLCFAAAALEHQVRAWLELPHPEKS